MFSGNPAKPENCSAEICLQTAADVCEKKCQTENVSPYFQNSSAAGLWEPCYLKETLLMQKAGKCKLFQWFSWPSLWKPNVFHYFWRLLGTVFGSSCKFICLPLGGLTSAAASTANFCLHSAADVWRKKSRGQLGAGRKCLHILKGADRIALSNTFLKASIKKPEGNFFVANRSNTGQSPASWLLNWNRSRRYKSKWRAPDQPNR